MKIFRFFLLFSLPCSLLNMCVMLVVAFIAWHETRSFHLKADSLPSKRKNIKWTTRKKKYYSCSCFVFCSIHFSFFLCGSKNVFRRERNRHQSQQWMATEQKYFVRWINIKCSKRLILWASYRKRARWQPNQFSSYWANESKQEKNLNEKKKAMKIQNDKVKLK